MGTEKPMIERTLVLIKPDGVQRGLSGEIIKRFEQRGLKIVAMKMVQPTKEQAEKHYREDIAQKHGKKVRDMLIEFITSAPVVAMVVEGIQAIEATRRMVGSTYPFEATPGTIRGDFSHVSQIYANTVGIAVKNLVHASGNNEEAEIEIPLWFKKGEMYEYKRAEELHIFGW